MEEKMSLWKKFYGAVWGSPSKTFENIVQKPDFWGAAILMMAVSLLMSIPILPKIREAVILNLQNAPPEIKLTPAQIDTTANWAVYTTPVFSLLGPLLIWLIIALLLKLFNAFTGEKAQFKTLFAVSVFSYLPVVLDGIIKTPLVMAAEAQRMTQVTISPAMFLPPPDGLTPDRMYTFFSQFDPFIIWSLVLTALGASIAMKVPVLRAGIYVFSLWMIFVLGVTFLSGGGAA
ncbi:MAG: YIP1 family protein [Bacillota bacterium]